MNTGSVKKNNLKIGEKIFFLKKENIKFKYF
jgi:hypothetical protein